jgi:hypothetical protein
MLSKLLISSRRTAGMLLCIIGAAIPAGAAMMYLIPSAGEIGIGEVLSVDVIAESNGTETIGSFDFTVEYDPGIFEFVSGTVPASIGGIDESDAFSEIVKNGASVNTWWVSSVEDLSGQETKCTLVTLIFRGAGLGTGTLSIGDGVLFGDQYGNPIASVDREAPVSVKVPEPTAFSLSAIGILGLIIFGVRRKKSRDLSENRPIRPINRNHGPDRKN